MVTLTLKQLHIFCKSIKGDSAKSIGFTNTTRTQSSTFTYTKGGLDIGFNCGSAAIFDRVACYWNQLTGTYAVKSGYSQYNLNDVYSVSGFTHSNLVNEFGSAQGVLSASGLGSGCKDLPLTDYVTTFANSSTFTFDAVILSDGVQSRYKSGTALSKLINQIIERDEALSSSPLSKTGVKPVYLEMLYKHDLFYTPEDRKNNKENKGGARHQHPHSFSLSL